MKRIALAGFTFAAGTLLIPVASAQAPSPQERAAALKQSLAANQAALHQYSWVETTTISLKGEVKKQEEKQCYYGADDVQQCLLGRAERLVVECRAGIDLGEVRIHEVRMLGEKHFFPSARAWPTELGRVS